MRRLRAFVVRFAGVFNKGRRDREFAEELESNLQMHIEDNLRAGMTPEEARRQALIKLGGVEQAKERYHERLGIQAIESVIQDVRFGLRQLRRNPGFTVVAIVTLALGIGANTAIFSMVRGILLSALPYEQPQRLYTVRQDVLWQGHLYHGNLDNGGNFLMWQRNCHSFDGMAALEPNNADLNLKNSAVQVHGTRASWNLFSILGVEPMLGRSFLPQEGQAGRNWEVILTYPLWRARFNSDLKITGKVIRLNGYDFTVVGVLPASFYFPRFDQLDGGAISGWTHTIQYFVPLGLQPWESKPSVGNMNNFTVIARLKPGLTRQQAVAELDTVDAEITRRDPHADGAVLRGELLPLKAAIVSATNRMLWMLMGGAGLVLLIVCVNLASLLLARSMSRNHEIAVRAALGATRWSLLRQFLTEGVLVVLAGGVLGVLLAAEGLRAIVYHAPLSIPRLDSIHIDAQVLLFSLAISLVAGLLFSALPGMRLTKTRPADALKSAAATTTGAHSTARLRSVLASAEVALCTILLISALLLFESLTRVLKENSWMEVQHAVAVDLQAPSKTYDTQAKTRELYNRLLRNIRALPGVLAAGFSSALPLTGERWGESFDFQEAPQPDDKQTNANVRFASAEFFQAIGLPLINGRVFSAKDKGQDEVILSEGFARHALPGRSPIGMHLRWHDPNTGKLRLCSVVGIVGDARTDADQEAPPIVYFPYWVWSPNDISLVVRTTADPSTIATEVQQVVRHVNDQIAIPREQTLKNVVSRAVAPRRFVASLAILFAGFASFLAALGLYGVISLSVAQRTQEIGIRMALGAQPRDVLRIILVKGLKLTLAGTAVGILAALAVTRLISSLLYGVKPTDAATFILVSLFLIGVSILASYVPARRAIRVDPMSALRHE
jgi:predicted permease